MAYCAICGKSHDPDVGCFDGTKQVLENVEADTPKPSSHENFRQIARKADRWFIKALLWSAAIVILLLLLFSLLSGNQQ